MSRLETVQAHLRKVAHTEGTIKCGVCGQGVSGAARVCATCETPHHVDCWTYNEGCSVFGCRASPERPEPMDVEIWIRDRSGRDRAIGRLAVGFAAIVVLGATAFFFRGRSDPPPAAVTPVAPAPSWDVSGTWQVSNMNGYGPQFIVQQVDNQLGGVARLSDAERDRGDYLANEGSLTGSITGDRVHVLVTWSPKRSTGKMTQGHYEGTIKNGRIEDGFGYDAVNPDRRGKFTATVPMRRR